MKKQKNVKSANSKNTTKNITKEIWRTITGYAGKYQVSNLGRVRSLNHSTEQTIVSCKGTQFTCVKNYSGRILKPCQDNYGYFHVRLYSDRKAQLFKVHKLVAMMFLDNFAEDLTVDHINCDKSDNRAQNLQMLSLTENIRIRTIEKPGINYLCIKLLTDRLFKNSKFSVEKKAGSLTNISFTNRSILIRLIWIPELLFQKQNPN